MIGVNKIKYLKKALLFAVVFCGGCHSPIRLYNYEQIQSPGLCIQLSRSVKQQQIINYTQNNKKFQGKHFATYVLPAFIDQTCDILDDQAIIKSVNLGVSFALDKNDENKEYIFFDFEMQVEFPNIGGNTESKLLQTKSHIWIYPDEYRGIKLRAALQKFSSEALSIGFKNIINQIKEELKISVGKTL